MPYGANIYGEPLYGGMPSPPPTPVAPVVVTLAATDVRGTSANLHGTVNPGNADTTVYFQWGTSTAYGNTTSAQDAGAGGSTLSVSAPLGGLTPNVTYHYRIVGTNSQGTAFGADMQFVIGQTPMPAPAGATVPALTYLFYDLRSGAYLGRLPLKQVTFGSQLLVTGSAGTLSGTIDLSDARVQALAPLTISQPGRSAVFVDYNGALVWGGIVWNRNRKTDGTARELSITATELWSYFQQRVQATDYSAPPYSGITGNAAVMPIWDASGTDPQGVYDPVLIAWQIISDAISVTNANIVGGLGIAANSYTTAAAYLASGTNTPLGDYLGGMSYPEASAQVVHSIVSMLAANGFGVGFDYGVDVAYSAGAGSRPAATVNLSYPRRGRTYAQNSLVLNCGSAISYEIPEDGTQAANTVYEQGASGSLVISQNVNPIDGGYPVLEAIKSRANMQSANMLSLLQQIGIADLVIGSYPVVTPTVTMDLFKSTVPFGDFIVGDNCRLIVPATDGTGSVFDPLLPNGIDSEWRIAGYSATVSDEGQSKITFNLVEPPVSQVTAPAL